MATPPKVQLPKLAPPAPLEELQRVDYAPNEKDSLIITWIGGLLECAAYRKGCFVSDFVSHPDCISIKDFHKRLGKSIESLGFKGQNAELLLDGGPLDTMNLILPPISNRLQNAFVKEKAKRIQSDKGPLVWERQRIASAKTGARVLLHYITKSDFKDLNGCFSDHNLSLKKVLPFFGSTVRPFRDLNTTSGSTSIVLAPAGPGFKILSIDDNGDLQFARDLNKENGKDPQRVAVEINRCLLFARQQFGKPVSQISIVGMQAARFKAGIKKVLQGEIPIMHKRTNKTLWLQVAAHSNAFNLAKESMLQDRKRRWQKTIATAACLLLGGASLAYTYHIEHERAALAEQVRRLAANEVAMQETIDRSQFDVEEAERHHVFLEETSNLGRLPIEHALISLLSQNLPNDTWVSILDVEWSQIEKQWTVRITLRCDADPQAAERRRASLTTALSESAFSMNFAADSLEELRNVTVQGSERMIQTISIEGFIQEGGSHGI